MLLYTTSSRYTAATLFRYAFVGSIRQYRPTSFSATTLEVERKFSPTPSSMVALESNCGQPPFKYLTRQEDSRFEDVYYDYNDILSRTGIWLRSRNGEWEAKVRTGGNFTNSSFREISGQKPINQLLSSHFHNAYLTETGLHGMQEIARFVTTRRQWCANNRFTIVVDIADFGHTIGEVELQHAWDELAIDDCLDLTKALDKEIEHFMKKHNWAFPQGDAPGKLSAYLTRKSSNRF